MFFDECVSASSVAYVSFWSDEGYDASFDFVVESSAIVVTKVDWGDVKDVDVFAANVLRELAVFSSC